MKESYDEGLANHIGPESCADNGNIIGEALTGESAGWVLSPVRDINPSADALQVCRRQHPIDRFGEGYESSAGSETPVMHGSSFTGIGTPCIRPRLIALRPACRTRKGHGHGE